MLKAFIPLLFLFVATACTPPTTDSAGMKCECCQQMECCCKGKMKDGMSKDKMCEKCLKKKGVIKETPAHKM